MLGMGSDLSKGIGMARGWSRIDHNVSSFSGEENSGEKKV